MIPEGGGSANFSAGDSGWEPQHPPFLINYRSLSPWDEGDAAPLDSHESVVSDCEKKCVLLLPLWVSPRSFVDSFVDSEVSSSQE